MALTIYHNPRCSKSRAALALLESAGARPTVVRYLEDPPEATRILAIAGLLGVPVAALLRRDEEEYRAAADRPDETDDVAMAAWLAQHPRVLVRPIVVDDISGRAIVGRPPERVATLLE
jgi:arsenate reductase